MILCIIVDQVTCGKNSPAITDRRTVLVCTGGGTAGHVFPGLAVIEQLSADVTTVVWIGSRRGIEREIVTARGIQYVAIPSGKLRRYLSVRNLTDIFRVLAGIVVSLFVLARLKPACLFSKGGFVAVPPVIAAWILRIPIITHESDYDPGLATRIIARFADRVCVAYPETAGFFAARYSSRIVVTGNPVRSAITRGVAEKGRKFIGLEAAYPVVFVLGGSLGAVQINDLIAMIRPQLLDRCFLVHQTGAHEQGVAVPGCFSRPFFRDELPDILAAADLVVSRAGAGSIWEFAATGTPAILIPLPGGGSRGDQIRNADVYARSGAALVLDPETVTAADLLRAIDRLLSSADEREKMSAAARGFGASDAASRVAELIGAEIPVRQ